MLSLSAGRAAELNDQPALVVDSDERAAVLAGLGMAAHRRKAVNDDQLSYMLEFTESARLWSLIGNEN